MDYISNINTRFKQFIYWPWWLNSWVTRKRPRLWSDPEIVTFTHIDRHWLSGYIWYNHSDWSIRADGISYLIIAETETVHINKWIWIHPHLENEIKHVSAVNNITSHANLWYRSSTMWLLRAFSCWKALGESGRSNRPLDESYDAQHQPGLRRRCSTNVAPLTAATSRIFPIAFATESKRALLGDQRNTRLYINFDANSSSWG